MMTRVVRTVVTALAFGITAACSKRNRRQLPLRRQAVIQF